MSKVFYTFNDGCKSEQKTQSDDWQVEENYLKQQGYVENPNYGDPEAGIGSTTAMYGYTVDGITGAELCKAAGHVISQYGSTYDQTYNNYQFTVTSGTATNGNTQGGGGSISIGPVTLQA